jgi:hypothetical protein
LHLLVSRQSSVAGRWSLSTHVILSAAKDRPV